MKKEIIYSLQATYREPMDVQGYTFGKGEKSACIIGAIRGNEVQQLYVCSQLVKALSELEQKGAIVANNEILVIPSVNRYSMNIGKRFWAMDHSDINRMFPGNPEGETTARIAAGVFEKIKEYSYGIQFASFYLPGDFIPHVSMMETGYQSASLANLFGLPYTIIRKPRPIDTTTLNYNWQMWKTNTFSIYTNETEYIDELSAKQAVSAVLRFLTRMGIIKYNTHSGYISTSVNEDEFGVISTECGGIYKRLKKPGEEIRHGEVVAEILDPYEGYVKKQVLSPTEGIIFFAHNKPLVTENEIVYKVIRRLHE